MKLTFLGTRAFIDESSPSHRSHSALLVEKNRRNLMIDCGLDWLGRLNDPAPQAILLTHAHPDHSGGLRDGAPGPVYATIETWQDLDDLPLAERRTVNPGVPLLVGDLRVTPVAVAHSLRAPAVGYRIEDDTAGFFYGPDVASLPEPRHALSGLDLYVGDGTAGTGSLLRVEEGRLCGHAPLATQLNWCRKAGVPRMVVSHCGSELVSEEPKGAAEQLTALGDEFGVAVEIAQDGMQLELP